MSDEETVPTYGYKSGEEPRIFELKKGESLPSGWHDTPQPDKPVKGKKAKVEEAEEPKEDDGDGN